MKLTAHVLDGHTLDVRPAPRERPWMDRTAERYAYRCLPLDIANAHGWELLCQTAFEAEWNGGNALDDLRVQPAPGTHAPAVSHFGYGVLTFHVPCLFRTEAGVDLYVTAPVNRPKDGIAGLTGLIETDWSPYTFTMNWQFTRPGRVRFEAGEPFCHFFPVQRRVLARDRAALAAAVADAGTGARTPGVDAQPRAIPARPGTARLRRHPRRLAAQLFPRAGAGAVPGRRGAPGEAAAGAVHPQRGRGVSVTQRAWRWRTLVDRRNTP